MQLDASGSSDPDEGCGDSIVQFEWDLMADGSYEYTGANPTVPWAALSSLPQGVANPVRLRVTDTMEEERKRQVNAGGRFEILVSKEHVHALQFRADMMPTTFTHDDSLKAAM